MARLILNYRIFWLGALISLSLFMAYWGTRIQLSYQIARILPLSDPIQQHYEQFKTRFGADGALMVIGWQDERWFDLPLYQDWYDMTRQVERLSGVKQVLSTAQLFTLRRDSTAWCVAPLVTQRPTTQAQADSIRQQVLSLPFYRGLLVNPDTKATLMAVTFDEKKLNSRDRIALVDSIRTYGQRFSQRHQLALHYSGLPSIRTEVMKKVSGEMTLFLALAAAVTGLLVWGLFRSWRVVALSLVVVGMGVCVSIGTLSLLGYEITLLTGLLPPLLLVVGVPNCVFLVNRYRQELALHGEQRRALDTTIREVGLSALLANVTTAIGFGVFYFTNSRLLMEFGLVAAICVLAVYVICLLLVPIFLSYLPVPHLASQTPEAAGRWSRVLAAIDGWVHTRRRLIYGIISVITVMSALGLLRIQVEGYVVDDLPKNDPVYTDLRFIEQHFKGALPFEIMIDTGQPNGVTAQGGRVFYTVRALERVMDDYPEFSQARSLVDAVRFAYQMYRGGEARYYVLPPLLEFQKLAGTFSLTGNGTGTPAMAKAFIDKDRRIARVSYQMADIGSRRMQSLMAHLKPRLDSLSARSEYQIHLTGHSLVFLQSNSYLMGNLYESLLMAIVLIAIVGMFLFRSVPIILLSKLPCLIPLVVTAGVMGFTGIPFKPSTILVFSIAFGLSSDGTVYFLTSYRAHLKRGLEPSAAISGAIAETGRSLIDTALILAGGFSVFALSGFGGTAALGTLVATTVLMACLTNLILLPALLLSLKRYRV